MLSFISISVSGPPSALTRLPTLSRIAARPTSFLPPRLHLRASPCPTNQATHTLAQSPIRCDSLEPAAPLLEDEKTSPAIGDWKLGLCPGAVVEVFVNGDLRIATVVSTYDRGVIALFAQTAPTVAMVDAPVKVSFGEIISVWPTSLIPISDNSSADLLTAIREGLSFLYRSAPRTMDLTKVYNTMRRYPKHAAHPPFTSAALAEILFPSTASKTPASRAALAVVTSRLVVADPIRFKRAHPGCGWRALLPAVAISRGRCSFVDACNVILDPLQHTPTTAPSQPPTKDSRGAGKRTSPHVWSRDQLDILRDIEIVAASGSAARGTAATALKALGYAPDDDGAATLLLDIKYWATGPSPRPYLPPNAKDITNIHPYPPATRDSDSHPDSNSESADTSSASKSVGTSQDVTGVRNDPEWTFAPELLAEARDIRTAARERKRAYALPDSVPHNRRRRSMLHPPDGHPVLRAYCIDEKASRFLDDAISVQVLENGDVIRLWMHVADVDEIIKSGSQLDKFARERGQSLYLPLKPLHMLPAAAMEATSFNSTFPTEAITVMVDFDVRKDVVRSWEVFPSIVPPVRKLTYEQFDMAMECGAKAAQLLDTEYEDLRAIAQVAPLLADKVDARKGRKGRGGRREGVEQKGDGEMFEERQIAAVKLVKRGGTRGLGKGSPRLAKVVDFQVTRSHQTVDEVLTCAGGLIRQFARENRACLPEVRDACLFVARCGTAPLRRYGDLAIQRQVKCVLFGRQPAGKRRMDELRVWLAKRQSESEKTLTERRRTALFESFSGFCAQKCAVTGATRAMVRGLVRNVVVTKKGLVKVDVAIDGTGLSTFATMSEILMEAIFKDCEEGPSDTKVERLWKAAKKLMRPSTTVLVEIAEVNVVAYTIQACVVEILQ